MRYEAVNAMLLNEFLKEHRKNEKQEATIARLQEQIAALTAGLQKVSAQLEVSNFAPQVVLKISRVSWCRNRTVQRGVATVFLIWPCNWLK